MNAPNDLVVIRRFSTVPEARVAQSVIDAAGIPCDLADDNIIAAHWLYSNLVGGVKLRVPADRAEEAVALLDTAAEPLDDPASGTEHPFNSGDRCSVCGVADFEALTQGPSRRDRDDVLSGFTARSGAPRAPLPTLRHNLKARR